MAPFIKVAFRAACHPSSLHTAHKRKMCPDFHFCSIIKGKSKTAQIHHIVKLVSWLQCSLTQSNKSWWWCALGWKTELALKRQWVISMVLTWFVCVWMCHNASPSALPLQPAGEQVPAELLSWILPWQTGRRVQTLSPGLCYLCRWELGSQDPSFFVRVLWVRLKQFLFWHIRRIRRRCWGLQTMCRRLRAGEVEVCGLLQSQFLRRRAKPRDSCWAQDM